jgi:hypothetical protein
MGINMLGKLLFRYTGRDSAHQALPFIGFLPMMHYHLFLSKG